MRGLLDIQAEIKGLEKTVQDVASDLGELNRDIQALRTSGNDMDMDYGMVRLLAGNMPFGTHPLDKLEDEYACKIYIELLLCLLRLDMDGAQEKMIFIQWILDESGLEMKIEDAYLESLEVGKTILKETSNLLNENYKTFLITDMMILSNFNGKMNMASLEYIGNLCSVLGIEASRVLGCSVISKITLTQDVGFVTRQEIPHAMPLFREFRHYVSRDLCEALLSSLREIVVEMRDSNLYCHDKSSFKWKVKQQDFVKAGDIIAEYKVSYKEKKYIKAKSSGMIFQFRDKKTYYGVISYEADNKDRIKSWVQSMRKKR